MICRIRDDGHDEESSYRQTQTNTNIYTQAVRYKYIHIRTLTVNRQPHPDEQKQIYNHTLYTQGFKNHQQSPQLKKELHINTVCEL